MAKLEALMPHLGPAVRAVALQECDWNEERALVTLRRFRLPRPGAGSAAQGPQAPGNRKGRGEGGGRGRFAQQLWHLGRQLWQ